MFEQDKIAFAAVKGVSYKGALAGGGQDEGGDGGGTWSAKNFPSTSHRFENQLRNS